MRLILGLTLIFASIPYALYALTNGVREPYMGIVALVVSGGILVARAVRQRRPERRPGPMAVPPAWGPAIPAAPRVPTIEPPAVDPEPMASPAKADPPVPPTPPAPRREKKTILPPKPDLPPGKRPPLKLVYSDGKPCDVRAPRRDKRDKIAK